MSPLLFAQQNNFDTIWLNCTEEQTEQVYILSVGLHDLAELARTRCKAVCTLYSL